MWAQKQRSTETTPCLLEPDSSEGNRSRTEYGSGRERYTGDEEYQVAVQKVITPQSAVKIKPSYCYGKAGYEPHSCRFGETICHHCKKRGHLARGYRSKAPNVTGASGKALWRPRRGKRVPVKWLGMSMKKEAQPSEIEECVILQLGVPQVSP